MPDTATDGSGGQERHPTVGIGALGLDPDSHLLGDFEAWMAAGGLSLDWIRRQRDDAVYDPNDDPRIACAICGSTSLTPWGGPEPPDPDRYGNYHIVYTCPTCGEDGTCVTSSKRRNLYHEHFFPLDRDLGPDTDG